MAKQSAVEFLQRDEPSAEQEKPSKPDWVKVGIKMTVDDHARLRHNLAMQRTNLQDYGLKALSDAMEADGLAPLTPYRST